MTAQATDDLFERIADHDLDAVLGALAADPGLVTARDAHLGSTPLHLAAHRGQSAIVAALLDAGADVHARETASDTTPLHWAAEGGHPDIARRLVERGAALTAIDAWYGLTPLGWATIIDWAPQHRFERGTTAAYLHLAGARHDVFTAVVSGDVAALRVLVAGDASAVDRRLGFVGSAMTPLHLAVSRGLPAMVDALLGLGADAGALTAWSLTPLALALATAGDGAMVTSLRRHGAVDDAGAALLRGDLAALARHLDAGVDAPVRDPLLLVAAQRGLASGIELLTRRGSNPEVRAPYLLAEVPAMVVPLHLAAAGGHLAAVHALLAARAQPSPGAEDGLPTPLHLAAGHGHLEIVRTLLDHGADPVARERRFGVTAEAWAEHDGHPEVAAFLASRAPN